MNSTSEIEGYGMRTECCTTSNCNNKRAEPFKISTTQAPNTVQPTWSRPPGIVARCYECSYSRSGKVETGRECKDPVRHHDIALIPCSAPCSLKRINDPERDYESVSRSCADSIIKCEDTAFTQENGYSYDEHCCTQDLCNGVDNIKKTTSGASSMHITYTAILTVFVALLKLFL